VILVRYMEIPLLLRISKRTHENTSLYLIAGPALAIRRNAVIREVADAGRHEDIADQVMGSNLSYIGGGGLQHKRWLIDRDHTIKLVVLASAAGPGGPGPLVVQLGKSLGLGPRPVPVLVVPGALTREEVRKLALPVAIVAPKDEPDA
jgi:hypothetical protein